MTTPNDFFSLVPVTYNLETSFTDFGDDAPWETRRNIIVFATVSAVIEEWRRIFSNCRDTKELYDQIGFTGVLYSPEWVEERIDGGYVYAKDIYKVQWKIVADESEVFFPADFSRVTLGAPSFEDTLFEVWDFPHLAEVSSINDCLDIGPWGIAPWWNDHYASVKSYSDFIHSHDSDFPRYDRILLDANTALLGSAFADMGPYPSPDYLSYAQYSFIEAVLSPSNADALFYYIFPECGVIPPPSPGLFGNGFPPGKFVNPQDVPSELAAEYRRWSMPPWKTRIPFQNFCYSYPNFNLIRRK